MNKMTTISALFGAALIALPAFAADDELIVFDWSGYEDPNFFLAYNEKHGDDPTFTFFGEEEEAFQKLRSGFRADVSHPCSANVQKWREAGLIEPWDTSRIPAYGDLNQSFTGSEVFSHNGEVYFIPADWGSTAVAYNTEEVPVEDVASLQVFTNPKYAGRISIADNVDDVYALAYLAIGVTDWTKATEADFDAASAWLRKAHPNVRAYWADGGELSQLMASGEVLISWAWNETPVTMQGDGHPIGYQRETVEGTSTWVCGYVNLTNGPGSEDKAYDFMNAWLSEDTANYIVNEWGYGHSNAKVMATYAPEDIEWAGLAPVSVPVLAQLPIDITLRERQIAEFEKIKAGF